MKNAIIYDFDKTIYSRETSISFMFFYIKRHPLRIFNLLLFLLKLPFIFKDLKKTKNHFFKFINQKKLDSLDKDIIDFWNSQGKYFFSYFKNEIKENRREADVLILISASPDFLLEKIYKKLGFDILIATKYENFKMIGNNCKGMEKLHRLSEIGKFNVLSFYSDSMSDKPLFDIAERKFNVDEKGNLGSGLPKKNGVVDKWK